MNRNQVQDRTHIEQTCRDLLAAILQIAAFELTDLERATLHEVLIEKKNFREVGKAHQLTSMRAKHLFNNAILKLNRSLPYLEEKVRGYYEISKILPGIENELSQYRTRLTSATQNTLECRLEDTELSVRIINCCGAMDIYTLAELAQLTAEDVLKFRNCGKKSVKEIEDFLAKHGLGWGMTCI